MSNKIADYLISWYLKHGRELPWRSTGDAYKIWLSEIILQQTRVAQGMGYYQRFVSKYPTVKALAAASEEEVLRDWQGLGYYSRARNLLKCAKTVQSEYQGAFPRTYKELLKLPGIGKYTASAISSFAFGQAEAVVDGNVYRVIARLFEIENNIADPKNYKIFHKVASDLMPENQAGNFNQAIMELGATICTPKKFKCDQCPIQQFCLAFQNKSQASFPIKIKKSSVRNRFFYYVLWEKEGKIPMKKRKLQDIWNGMFDFKLIESKEALSVEQLRKELNTFEDRNRPIKEISEPVKHVLSHQVLHAQFIIMDGETSKRTEELLTLQEPDLEYFTIEETKDLPKPILIDKYLKQKFY